MRPLMLRPTVRKPIIMKSSVAMIGSRSHLMGTVFLLADVLLKLSMETLKN